MGKSLKAILQLTSIVSCIVALWVWFIPDRPDLTTWAFRIAMPVVFLLSAVVLFREARRKEILSDLLLSQARNYFERDGICFAFVPIAIQGISWMQIYFQNRYQKPCTARVILQPPREYFLGKQKPLSGIDVDLECDGAAFGVSRVPWPIPLRLQGKKAKFEVAANASYPAGRGKLVRFRDGVRAGGVGSVGGDALRAAAKGGLLLVGAIWISRPASLKMVLPSGVGEESPPFAALYTEMLFTPEFAVDGYPVLPTPQSAVVETQAAQYRNPR